MIANGGKLDSRKAVYSQVTETKTGMGRVGDGQSGWWEEKKEVESESCGCFIYTR